LEPELAEKTEGKAVENALGTERIGPLLVRYSIPAIVSNLVAAIYSFIDQILLGHVIGVLGIAATNIAFPLATICAGTGYLLGTGSASNFNLKLGQGDKDAANRFACNGLSLLTIVGVTIAIIVLILAMPLT